MEAPTMLAISLTVAVIGPTMIMVSAAIGFALTKANEDDGRQNDT